MRQNKRIKEKDRVQSKDHEHLLHLLALLKRIGSINGTRDLHNIVFSAQELHWIPNGYHFGFCNADFPAPYSPDLSFDFAILQLQALVTNGEIEEPIRLTKKGDEFIDEEMLKSNQMGDIKDLTALDSSSVASIAKYLQILKAEQYNESKAFEKATRYFFTENRVRELEEIIEKVRK